MTTSAPSPGAFSSIRPLVPGTQSSLRCSRTEATDPSEVELRRYRKAELDEFQNGSTDFRRLRW